MLRFLRSVLLGIVIANLTPYALAFASYGTTFGGVVEQAWLDRAIAHLRVLRSRCDDADLQGVLDYAIRRYNRIGPFDVAVSRCVHPLTSLYPDYRVIGVNNPLVPGLTLDIEVLSYPIHDGAMVLVHEALHDYWPRVGHSQIDPRMEKLERLWPCSR